MNIPCDELSIKNRNQTAGMLAHGATIPTIHVKPIKMKGFK